MPKIPTPIKHLLAIVFWLVVWHMVALSIANQIILVSPVQVFLRLLELIVQGDFWRSIQFSLLRIVLGFLLAMVGGIILAIVTSFSKNLYILFLPVINVIKAVPVASFTILALFWMSAANLSVFIAFTTVLPIIFFNAYKGITTTDKKMLEMAAVFRVPRRRILVDIYGANALPHVLAGASSGMGFAFKSGVAAELIGLVRHSIGFNLHSARTFLMTADVFAWTITIVLLSYIIEKIFVFLVRRMKNVHNI